MFSFVLRKKVTHEEKYMEDPGIDPGTSRMLSERSTMWASPPLVWSVRYFRGDRLLSNVRVQEWKKFVFSS